MWVANVRKGNMCNFTADFASNEIIYRYAHGPKFLDHGSWIQELNLGSWR